MAKATRWSEFKAPGTWPRPCKSKKITKQQRSTWPWPSGGVNSRHQVYARKRDKKVKENKAAIKYVAMATRWSEFKAPGTWPGATR